MREEHLDRMIAESEQLSGTSNPFDNKVIIIDEAHNFVSRIVNKLKSKDNAVLVITHYQRLLDHIVPDFVHVLFDGKIVKSGGKELAFELEEKGYDWIKEEIKS